jgi:electron transfer flavoprotein beta subunit
MKILTIVRQVPDAEASLRVANGAMDLAETQLVMDTMDEYGVEEALRLREAGNDAEIVAVAVGPASCEDALRSALALGADRAIHVKSDMWLDPIALSDVIAQVAKAEGAELIFCGGRQTDWDSEALGAAVAERMGWPQLTWTTELSLKNGTLLGRHDVDEGSERFSVALPAVVTTQQGLNDPRFATLPNLMKARRKELRADSLEAYEVSPVVRLVKSEIQARERRGEMLTGDVSAVAEKLASVLKAVAKGNA